MPLSGIFIISIKQFPKTPYQNSMAVLWLRKRGKRHFNGYRNNHDAGNPVWKKKLSPLGPCCDWWIRCGNSPRYSSFLSGPNLPIVWIGFWFPLHVTRRSCLSCTLDQLNISVCHYRFMQPRLVAIHSQSYEFLARSVLSFYRLYDFKNDFFPLTIFVTVQKWLEAHNGWTLHTRHIISTVITRYSIYSYFCWTRHLVLVYLAPYSSLYN